MFAGFLLRVFTCSSFLLRRAAYRASHFQVSRIQDKETEKFIVERAYIPLPVPGLVALCVLHNAFKRIQGGLHGVVADRMLDPIAHDTASIDLLTP